MEVQLATVIIYACVVCLVANSQGVVTSELSNYLPPTGLDKLHDVISVVVVLSERWKHFGSSLGLLASDLNAIPYHNSQTDDCLREVIELWLKQCYDVSMFYIRTDLVFVISLLCITCMDALYIYLRKSFQSS